jgi:BASS family bile acid:Na+ symporter
MITFFGLLRNRNVILALAILLGLLVGQGAVWTEQLVLPALGFVMTLSMSRVAGRLLRSPRAMLAPLIGGVAMNYVVLGGLILVLSRVLIFDAPMRMGFTIFAAVPPAVAVIPFTTFLHGDLPFTLVGTLGCYLGAFLLTPLILLTLLGASVDAQGLFVNLIELILLPLAVSRILRSPRVASRITPVRGPLINWSFFVVVYTVVGLNRAVFLSQPQSLLPAAVLTVAVTYALGALIGRVGRLRQIDPKRVTSVVLLGTFKNTGFAAGLALTLFGTQTAIPSTLYTIVMLSYIIFLDLRRR